MSRLSPRPGDYLDTNKVEVSPGRMGMCAGSELGTGQTVEEQEEENKEDLRGWRDPSTAWGSLKRMYSRRSHPVVDCRQTSGATSLYSANLVLPF